MSDKNNAMDQVWRSINFIRKSFRLRPRHIDQADVAALRDKLGVTPDAPYDIPFNAGFDPDTQPTDLEIKTHGTVIASRDISPQTIVARIETVPSGAPVVFDIRVNGASICAVKPSFAADSGALNAGTLIANPSIKQGDAVSLVVTGIGIDPVGAGLRVGVKGRAV
jgi:hypothetical protein